MRQHRQIREKSGAGSAANRVVEAIYCPRDGRRVSVTFEISKGPAAMHTGVVFCPFDIYGDRLDPPLGGNACGLPCLSPVGGRAFC
jgi:hypothetical protein